MRRVVYILMFFATLNQVSFGQELPMPERYSVVDSVSGDLDNDSINELVVAYNKEPDNEIDGVPRELVIYRLKNNKWIEWTRSDQALFGSKDGGMMGDPFGEITIENGILQISHYGGSSWKWAVTDKYRSQNGEFYLVGYTSIAGKPCEYWKDVDFNLSTGTMIVKKEYEECETENQEIYKTENEDLEEKGLKISIQNRHEREIKITTPKYGHDIYISMGKE